MLDKDIVEVSSGTRADMLAFERKIVETQPGDLNLEPWAGARAPQPASVTSPTELNPSDPIPPEPEPEQ